MNPKQDPLRDLVAEQLNQQWLSWSQRHPHLAAAIDRVTLIDSAVQRLRDDPAFHEAMARAELDEAKLAEAARVLSLTDGWVRRALGL